MANTRELSQLASLINVNDETKSIRVIANQPEAKIGIGTENPITKVDVIGDVNVSGAITATSFYGDGSNLSNIISGVGIQSAGSIIGTGVTTLNFVGAGNTFTINGSTVDISISGGGASVSISTEAPSNPSEGDLWYSSILGRTFIYYSDADSSQWVDASPYYQKPEETGIGIATAGGIVGYGVTTLDFRGSGISTVTVASNTGTIFIEGGGGGGASVSISTEAPSNPSEGDLWYSPTYGRTFIYYSDVDSSQWVDTAPFNIPKDDPTPGKTSETFTATEGQTVFSFSYEIGYIDVFLNGIRLSASEFIADNGTLITLTTPASENDVLDVVEYTMGIGDPGPPGAGGPIDNITETTSDGTFYPVITTGIGTTIPYITTTNDYFEFNPASGTLTTNQLNIVGVVTASAFFGDGSGLSGVSAGSTVADDTSTNATFYPLFTQQTSGTVSASKISTTKLSFNPSTGTLNATELNSTSDIDLKENIRPIENSLDKVLQINGVEFDWKDNHQSSVGVIAQEVEKVFPSLVKTAENKSVNYNGLIGVLIEAIKEQQEQINTLKKRIEGLEG